MSCDPSPVSPGTLGFIGTRSWGRAAPPPPGGSAHLQAGPALPTGPSLQPVFVTVFDNKRRLPSPVYSKRSFPSAWMHRIRPGKKICLDPVSGAEMTSGLASPPWPSHRTDPRPLDCRGLGLRSVRVHTHTRTHVRTHVRAHMCAYTQRSPSQWGYCSSAQPAWTVASTGATGPALGESRTPVTRGPMSGSSRA